MKAAGELHRYGVSANPLERKAYRAWIGMRQRCFNVRHKQFKDWGGRGITVCERWCSFLTFIHDVGLPPGLSYTVDRIDVNGHYEPGNVRWTKTVTQNRNQRTTKLSLALADQIRTAHRSGTKVATLALQYDMHRSNIYDIVNGHKWSRGKAQPKKPKIKRLTLETAKLMRTMYASGVVSQRKVAEAFGISRPIIQSVLENRTYKDPAYTYIGGSRSEAGKKAWVIRRQGRSPS